MHSLNRWLNSLKAGMEASKVTILSLLMYIILTIIFTYPVAFSGDKIPGCGDAYWFLWDFWWFKKAIFGFIDPYNTPYIFYPTGVNLAFSTVSPLNVLLSIPLQQSFGLLSAYKIIWISTFFISGFGTFLLVRYLTNNAKAAFVSGLIFMFCPYRFEHALGFLNLISTGWIPFYVLFLIKIMKENNRFNIVYAAVFLSLIALSDYQYYVFLISLTLIYPSFPSKTK